MSRSKPHKLSLFLVTREFHEAKYLGRQFYELLGEERFDEEKFASSTFLNRPATANASPEFTQHLVKSACFGNRISKRNVPLSMYHSRQVSSPAIIPHAKKLMTVRRHCSEQWRR